MANNDQFYVKGKSYWENVPATINGMLGGHTKVDKVDIQASSRFINGFFQDKDRPLGTEHALDCGSGIGRTTKHLLLKFFKGVDMVEQNQSFLDASHAYLGEDSNRVSRRHNCGLQDFVPYEKFYDVIWIQWVIGYLTDDDLVSCLKRFQKGLRENGLIVLKENVSTEDTNVEHEDGSTTRTRENFLQLFDKANLKLIAERRQYKFPKGLHQVKMFALR